MTRRYIQAIVWAVCVKCARCRVSVPDGGGRMMSHSPVLSKEVWLAFDAGRRLPGAYYLCLDCEASS